MSTGIIIGMISIGVASTVGEKVLNSFGKSDMASFVNIAGLVGLGITALGAVAELIKRLGSF